MKKYVTCWNYLCPSFVLIYTLVYEISENIGPREAEADCRYSYPIYKKNGSSPTFWEIEKKNGIYDTEYLQAIQWTIF